MISKEIINKIFENSPILIFDLQEKYFPITIEKYVSGCYFSNKRLVHDLEYLVEDGEPVDDTGLKIITDYFKRSGLICYVTVLPYPNDKKPNESISINKNFIVSYNFIFPFRTPNNIKPNVGFIINEKKNISNRSFLANFHGNYRYNKCNQFFGQVKNLVYKYKDINTLEEIWLPQENDTYDIIKNPRSKKDTFFVSLGTHNFYKNNSNIVVNKNLSTNDITNYNEMNKYNIRNFIKIIDVNEKNIINDKFGKPFDWVNDVNYYGNLKNNIFIDNAGNELKELTITRESTKGPLYRIQNNLFKNNSFFTLYNVNNDQVYTIKKTTKVYNFNR